MNSLKILLAGRKLFEARPNPEGYKRTVPEARLYDRWYAAVSAVADALEAVGPFDRTEFVASCQGLSKDDFVALRLT